MKTEIDDSVKKGAVAPLGATFAPQARARITEYLQSFESFEPTLGLLYGAILKDGSGKGSWSLAALDSNTVADLVNMYDGFGSVVCYELDGIRVVIPQLAHIGELESGVLDFVGDRIAPVTAEKS